MKRNKNRVGVMNLDFEGEDGDDQGGVREAAVDRGRGVHRKDVSASGTPEVKAMTIYLGECGGGYGCSCQVQGEREGLLISTSSGKDSELG